MKEKRKRKLQKLQIFVEIFLTVRSRFWYVIKCTICAAVILHHTCPKSGWKLRPKTLIRSLVRSLVCFVRPSVSSPEPNFLFSLSLSLSPRARALSLLSFCFSPSRASLALPHLLLLFASLLLSLLWFCFCLECSLVDFHFYFYFFGSRTFFFRVF